MYEVGPGHLTTKLTSICQNPKPKSSDKPIISIRGIVGRVGPERARPEERGAQPKPHPPVPPEAWHAVPTSDPPGASFSPYPDEPPSIMSVPF